MFSENKGFSIYQYIYIFFCKQTYNIQGSTLQPLKTLKRLNLLDFLGNMSQIYEFYWFISKQTWESFVFIKHCYWTIFFYTSWLDCLHCNITIKKTKQAELSWYYFYEYSDSKSLLATTKKWYNFENLMNSLLESMWLLLTWFYYKEQKIMPVEKYFFFWCFFHVSSSQINLNLHQSTLLCCSLAQIMTASQIMVITRD